MDFGALPPEVNSGRMYTGPGPASLLAASAGWESLAAELTDAAAGYESVITTVTQDWQGPTSMSMAAAVAPYVTWMRATAEQCEQAANQATAAAGAYETAYAMTVPPPLIAVNRAQLMTLVATNIFGQNTPAIMATEAQYSEMWAQDATAMYNYAASSASASAFSVFAPPPQTTNPGGVAGQAGAVAQSAGGNVQSATTQLMSTVPQALQGLSTPGSSSASGLSSAAMGTGASLGSSGASAPLSALSSLTGASSKTATKSASALSGLSSSLTSVLSGSGATGLFDVVGIGSDFAGLGGDGAGLGADGGGIGMDLYGLSIDFQGAGTIIGAEGGALPAGLGGDLGLAPLGGLGEGASAGVGQAASLGTLSVPPSWADAVSSVAPLPGLDANVMPGGWGAAPTPSAPSTAGISKLPLGGMVGRESDGAVQRIGFRSSLIPRSPVAG
ncbi:PPE family protein [Mycobacterium parmense]|uniref:Uncharacterized protein n=1 Tax=Mycobacterium parmense TaxID=185642 RepID=A0A7I7Z2C3_9MYCO|nr:PPE family protein [Mycobacterium parmense]MCV7352038.1 PPE family protein [Mycobacterium parmense]ORW56050.1 hypothetical protein AWC20_15015 [Mycobacterium parmense]BBZ48246.1 hypothetical protein MPRM_55270 [Mycobacterium parmense]